MTELHYYRHFDAVNFLNLKKLTQDYSLPYHENKSEINNILRCLRYLITFTIPKDIKIYIILPERLITQFSLQQGLNIFEYGSFNLIGLSLFLLEE